MGEYYGRHSQPEVSNLELTMAVSGILQYLPADVLRKRSRPSLHVEQLEKLPRGGACERHFGFLPVMGIGGDRPTMNLLPILTVRTNGVEEHHVWAPGGETWNYPSSANEPIINDPSARQRFLHELLAMRYEMEHHLGGTAVNGRLLSDLVASR